MKIAYSFEGKPYVLTFVGDEWSGGHPGYANALNLAFVATVGRYEYYPTPWHQAAHVAQVLSGTVDELEPDFEKGEAEGKVF